MATHGDAVAEMLRINGLMITGEDQEGARGGRVRPIMAGAAGAAGLGVNEMGTL
jgi:hypothetical protein